MAVYVDDILLTENSDKDILPIKQHLDNVFTIKDLGPHFFLGIEISYTTQGMILTQQKYTKDLLKSSGVSKFKYVVTPLPLYVKLRTSDGEVLQYATPYRSLVGKLNFLTNTRTNISFSVLTLSQFVQDPRNTHWNALLYTLKSELYTFYK